MQLQALCLSQAQKLESLPGFSVRHERLVLVLAQLKSNVLLLEQKKMVIPGQLKAIMNQEILLLNAEIQRYSSSYERFQDQMRDSFQDIADFSFVIHFQSNTLTAIMKNAAWSVGLCLTATVGLIVFVASASLNLAWTLALLSMLAVGLILGIHAAWLSFHQVENISSKSYDLLPSWNCTGTK